MTVTESKAVSAIIAEAILLKRVHIHSRFSHSQSFASIREKDEKNYFAFSKYLKIALCWVKRRFVAVKTTIKF